MESAPDLLHLFVQALTLVATSLDRWFHIPWSLPIAALFIPVLITLDVVVWYLRGMVFPVHCGYPRVKQGPCSRPAVGEWHKCWYHGERRLRRTDRHLVDPSLERWKNQMRNGVASRPGKFKVAAFLVCGPLVTPCCITRVSRDLPGRSSKKFLWWFETTRVEPRSGGVM